MRRASVRCVSGLMPAARFSLATSGKLPPLVRLNALLRATDAIHGETETAEDLRFLLGAGSPLGGARPKAAVSLGDGPARYREILQAR